ncbi:MAG: DUF1329 domain-containing protein [Pseudomonadales bacterium]|nr:DUF1329 domain-containing protein [Pseudomonadales bacterium]
MKSRVKVIALVTIFSLLSALVVYLLMKDQTPQVVFVEPEFTIEMPVVSSKKIVKKQLQPQWPDFPESDVDKTAEPSDGEAESNDEPVAGEPEPFTAVNTAFSFNRENLTPIGAERNANEDGSIPAWKGIYYGLPEGLTYQGSGDVYPDIYAEDQRLFNITAKNMQEYENKLSEGLLALLDKYPKTFTLPVYPSHRDFRINDRLVARTHWNAMNSKLTAQSDGLKHYTGGFPFPLPKNAVEVMWNARLAQSNPTLKGTFEDIAIYSNGDRSRLQHDDIAEFPYNYDDNPLGADQDAIGKYQSLLHSTMKEPARQRGEMIMQKQALNPQLEENKAWIYTPGSRRVRRAPSVNFDTPTGPGRLLTVDDVMGFNGSLERYDWQLIGKKEAYIPYHAYKFDNPKYHYKKLLQNTQVNADFMRYELHRVWVVEARLKVDARHVYAKRRFYIDEDSWQIVLLESYDRNDELWRVGILNTVYDYALKAYIARAQIFYDLRNDAYIAMRLVNEGKQPVLIGNPKAERYYSPSNLKKLGNR